MGSNTLLTILIGFATCLSVKAASTNCSSNGVVFCYYGGWANERSGNGRFGVSDIPSELCTHVIYSFIAATADGGVVVSNTEQVLENKSNTLKDFSALKEKNANLKLMVAIGGWSAGSDNFTIVVNNDTLRANFVTALVSFLDTYSLDGLDLDWEYPAQRGGADTDKAQFVTLVKELKSAFKSSGYLLTAAVAVTQSNIDLSYNVTELNEYLDYFNLMNYDYHGSWESVSGVNAPLYAQLTDASGTNLNVNHSVNVWIANGASPSKLVLGLGAYGKSFTLTSTNDTGTGAAVTGAGAAGPYLAEAGSYAYYEICEAQQNDTSAWSITEVTGSYVYASNDVFWVGYDNPNTIYAKAQFAKSMSLAGIMYWAVDLDDFGGLCGSKFPLISQGIAGYNSA